MSATPKARGWYNLTCWNGLSQHQQSVLIRVGTLPIGSKPMGECLQGAAVAIETEDDTAPGPRFYCRPCAIAYLNPVTDWPALAADMLSDDPERMRRHLPEYLRGGGE